MFSSGMLLRIYYIGGLEIGLNRQMEGELLFAASICQKGPLNYARWRERERERGRD